MDISWFEKSFEKSQIGIFWYSLCWYPWLWHDVQNFIRVSYPMIIPWYPIQFMMMTLWWDSDKIPMGLDEFHQSSDLDLLEIQWETCSAQRKRISGSSSSSSAKHLKWCWNWKMGNSLSDSDMIVMEFHGVSWSFWWFFWISWRMFIGLIILDPVYIYIYYYTYIYRYYIYIYILFLLQFWILYIISIYLYIL